MLTKTRFLQFLTCPNEFWLAHHLPLLAAREETLEYQHLRQQGYAVQRLVREMPMFRGIDPALYQVDFERAFKTDDLYAKSDVVVTDKRTGQLSIYEIKSSSKVKDEHIYDVAFQRAVAELNGFNAAGTYVITMNGDYVRYGELVPDDLFIVNDVTDRVAAKAWETKEQIANAFKYLKTMSVPNLLEYCDANKLDCSYIKHHFPDLPEYTVFDIAYLKNDKRRELLGEGIVAVTDVPEHFALSPKQKIQVATAKSGQIFIDTTEIGRRFDDWEYPLHFLDYETFSYAIPQFDGIRPFQQMCFQYSLHTIVKPGGETTHSHFLSRGDDDPPRAMAAHLREAMGCGIGTVFVWYEPFEKGRNSEMAAMFPEFKEFFEEVNAKTYDLMKIFSDNLYIHPEFKGRTSIKKVLPVLCPDLSYSELGIGDGMTASISWFHMATKRYDDSRSQQIFDDLCAYCHLDTLAMVEIFTVLRKLEK
ncbi:MAG: DUF2779 domain-containing protein [Saprospiraceae bacterium]|nr:DUF2779 domain-containing protein [Pyrinomonadaceae bacterium]